MSVDVPFVWSDFCALSMIGWPVPDVDGGLSGTDEDAIGDGECSGIAGAIEVFADAEGAAGGAVRDSTVLGAAGKEDGNGDFDGCEDIVSFLSGPVVVPFEPDGSVAVTGLEKAALGEGLVVVFCGGWVTGAPPVAVGWALA